MQYVQYVYGTVLHYAYLLQSSFPLRNGPSTFFAHDLDPFAILFSYMQISFFPIGYVLVYIFKMILQLV